MSTSDKKIIPHLTGALAGTVFLAIFGAIYEVFSHGVYSFYMIYAFAIPLILGVIPYTLMLIKDRCPTIITLRSWNSAISTLAVGSLFKGVLDIYGTSNSLIIVYPIAAGIFAVSALVSAIFRTSSVRCCPCTDRTND